MANAPRKVPMPRAGRASGGGSRATVPHPGMSGEGAAGLFQSPFQPPSGTEDFHGDAHQILTDEWYRVMEGDALWRVHRPDAGSIALLNTVMSTANGHRVLTAVAAFLQQLMHPEDYVTMLYRLADPDDDFNHTNMNNLLRSVATVGTARPFGAVAGLVGAAVHSWRYIRAKLALSGLTDPLRQLPSMHAVLDIVEHMAVESKVNEGGDALQRFYFELYKPDEKEIEKLRTEADTDSSFDNFAAMGMH